MATGRSEPDARCRPRRRAGVTSVNVRLAFPTRDVLLGRACQSRSDSASRTGR
jgi:hypothetical protein